MFAHRATPRSPAQRRPPRAASLAAAVLIAACVTPKERQPTAEARPGRAESGAPAARPAQAPTPPVATAPAPGDADAARAAGEADARRAREAAETRERLQRVDASLAELKDRIDALDAAVRKPRPAEPSARERELEAEVKALRAAVDAQGQRLAALDRALAEARRGGERAVAQGRAPSPRPPAREAPDAGAPVPEDKAGVLALAREQERSGRPAVARELYEQYAAQFPGDPGTAEARFRLGELAFSDRRYRDAIVEFGRVAREFPASGQAPDALLRTAESMLRLDLQEDAAAVLAQIPERYPGTPAAARARKQLAQLPGSGGRAR